VLTAKRGVAGVAVMVSLRGVVWRVSPAVEKRLPKKITHVKPFFCLFVSFFSGQGPALKNPHKQRALWLIGPESMA